MNLVRPCRKFTTVYIGVSALLAMAAAILFLDVTTSKSISSRVRMVEREQVKEEFAIALDSPAQFSGESTNAPTSSSSKNIDTDYDDDDDDDGPPTKASKFNMDDGRPRNLHIAFMGDSVTRFQYIAFVFYLQYGRHVTDADIPHRLQLGKNLGKSGITHYNFTDILLRPNEECDCYRVTEWKPDVFVDNRYYIDPVRNNSVTLLLKYGKLPAHGHWHPSDVHDPHELKYVEEPYAWVGNWSVGIRHLSQLSPKPKYLIYNAGNHPNDMMKETVRNDIKNTLDETGIVGVYKWTVHKKGPMLPRGIKHEPAMCELMDNRCLDYRAWTKELNRTDYSDHVHLMAGPNQRMNEEMLQMLLRLETNKTLLSTI